MKPARQLRSLFQDVTKKDLKVVLAYGECIEANLHDMKKDACLQEYMALKACFDRVRRGD